MSRNIRTHGEHTSDLIRITSDGSQQTIIRSGLCSSTTALDHLSRRLYWIDECGYKIEESLLDGSFPKTVVGGISDSNGVDFSRGLAQYRTICFATQKNHVYDYAFEAQGETNHLLYSVSSRMTLGGLEVVHSSKQPPSKLLIAILPLHVLLLFILVIRHFYIMCTPTYHNNTI